jgi:hypothetical protein
MTRSTRRFVVRPSAVSLGASGRYCPKPATVNVKIFNNRFSRIFYPKGGNYGPTSDCKTDGGAPRESMWSGNVWDDTGELIPRPDQHD